MAKVYIGEYDRLTFEIQEVDAEDVNDFRRSCLSEVPDELLARFAAAEAAFNDVQGELHPFWKATNYPDGYPIEVEARAREARREAERAVLERGLA